MRTLFKTLALLAVSFILIIVIGITLVVTLFNPNHFKTPISHMVKQKTGRSLRIKGNLSWSFFPWAGLQIKDATLSNSPQFGSQPFAHVEEADFSFKLLPLILGEVHIGGITLNNLNLTLIKKVSGKTNWEDLWVNKPQQSYLKESTHTIPTYISRINIKNAQINWIDQQKKQNITLKNFNLRSQNIGINKPFTITGEGDLISDHSPHLSTQLIFSSLINLSPQTQQYRFQNTRLKGSLNALNQNNFSNNPVHFDIGTNITFDQVKKNISVQNITAYLANIQLQGEIQATQDHKQTTLNGHINVLPFNLRDTLRQFDRPIHLKNPNALTQLNGDINFKSSQGKVVFNPLKFTVDNTQIDGNLLLQHLTSPTINFDLHLNTLTPELYQTLPLSKAQKASPAASVPSKTFISPFKTIQGNLLIDTLNLSKAALSKAHIKITAKGNTVQMAPITAQFYQGKLYGGLTIDSLQSIPHYTLAINLNKVNFEKMLSDLAGKANITGLLTLNTNLTTMGSNAKANIKNLKGEGNFNITNGYIKNIDASYILTQATALINKQLPSTQQNTQRTRFDKIDSRFTVKNGIVSNHDIKLYSPILTASGQGSTNLSTSKIQYSLKLSGVKSVTSNKGNPILNLNSWSVPIQVTGTLSSPVFKPDFNAMIKETAKTQVKKQIHKKLDEHLGDIGDAVGKTLDKLF